MFLIWNLLPKIKRGKPSTVRRFSFLLSHEQSRAIYTLEGGYWCAVFQSETLPSMEWIEESEIAN